MQRALEAALAAGASDDAPEVARCRARNAEVGKLVTIKELIGAGAVGELKSKFTASELKEAGVTVAEFKAADYQKEELKGVGFTCGDMYGGGYNEFILEDDDPYVSRRGWAYV